MVNQKYFLVDLIIRTRGLIVMLSVLLYHIPPGGYEALRHAEWYNVKIMDFILPCFITVFGTGMAFAYHRGIAWGKFLTRTIRLIVYGFIFNMIVAWSVDFTTLRITGVLQLYAVLGLVTVLLTTYIPWKRLFLPVILLVITQGWILLSFSNSCVKGLPQMDCNPSGIIDVIIFGASHLYRGGTAGYDPEGILTMFGALINVLIGFLAGKILLEYRKRGAWIKLFGLGTLVVVIAYFTSDILPYNKKIWTPTFALLTAGTSVVVLSSLYILVDVINKNRKNGLIWFIEAYGRNSFFIYFGKMVLFSIFTHWTINIAGMDKSVSTIIYDYIASYTEIPQLMYAFVMFIGWSLVAIILHKMKWYVKV